MTRNLVAGWMAVLAITIPLSTAIACSDRAKPIAVGGIDGFGTFTNPATTASLRSSCKVSLYIHGYIWTRIAGGHATRRAILNVFQGTGPAVVELGASTDPNGFFNKYYQHWFLDQGVVAHEAHINGAERLTFIQWQKYVTSARAHGLKIVAPVFAPNVGADWHDGTVTASLWTKIKALAVVGGGLTVDAPPSFFFWYTPAYRRFVVREIQWAERDHLLSTLIISPNSAGPRFLADTQRMIAYLQANNALPDRYIVENYGAPPGDKHFLNVVGPEGNRDTVAGVALWLTLVVPDARP